MKTIIISLADTTEDETVEAHYYQIEDSWITFKTEDHKAVASYPEARVTRIKSEDRAPTVTFGVTMPSKEDMERTVRTSSQNTMRWVARS